MLLQSDTFKYYDIKRFENILQMQSEKKYNASLLFDSKMYLT